MEAAMEQLKHLQFLDATKVVRRILSEAAVNTTAGTVTTPTANCSYMKSTSDGPWSGEKPIEYALPLLIIQLCLVLFFSRVFAFILKPLRQPRVVAEILGGIVLGVSVMGQIPGFTAAIFPPSSITVLTTVANMGLLYFLFMIGLELDIRALAKVGILALSIAAAGISVPFAMGIGVSFAARAVLGISSSFGPFLVFMGVAMSITAFPVLARILAERKLLTTDVGQMAMSAAAVNDIVAWVLLALAVALTSANSSAIVVLWILLCGVAFVVIMMLIVRPLMALAARGIVDKEPIPEWIVAITLVGVLVAGFTTDTIGIHGIFGAFVFGLCIPKDGPFGTMILEKIEDFVTIILLPLYFASSGLAVSFQSITSNSIGLLFLIVGTACVGKIGGTTAASLVSGLPFRKSLTLGILMNTKGLVELIVLNIGLTKRVIDQELYTIMVIMALFTTFMTTPLVMLIYAPARDTVAHTKRIMDAEGDANELRLLVCVHGAHQIPPMLNLTEVSRGTRKHPLRVFIMHLVELSERSSAIVMVTRVRKDGRPYWSKEAEKKGQDQVVVAFKAYAQLSRVNVQPLTCISGYDNMHEDICITALERRTSLIIVPNHKSMGADGEEVANHGVQEMNRKLLRTAPCSVAILVDRGLGAFSHLSPGEVEKKIAVLFFGGPDDREALTVARRMAEHPGVSLTVIRFRPSEEAAISLEIESQRLSASGGLGPASEGMTSRPSQDVLAQASFVVPLDKGVVEQEQKQDEDALAPLLAMLPVQARTASEPARATPQARDKRGQEAGGDVGAEEQQQPSGELSGALSGSVAEVEPARASKLQYEAREVDDAASAIMAAAASKYDLMIVGRGRRAPMLVAHMAFSHTPYRTFKSSRFHLGIGNTGPDQDGNSGTELGPVGDLLVASDTTASVLVVQQHDESMVRSMSLKNHH